MADGTPSSYNSEMVGKTLTKADFVESVYSRVGGLSRRDSAEIVDLLFESIKETLAEGEAVKISGFGNFVVREKKPRVGRNPQTGQDIEISARRVLSFKPSQVLKDQLND
jgi:integration host factor subunit alpha